MFTSFLEMVEADFGYETVDKIIESSNLASEGIYTSVGAYDDDEFEQLLTNLSIEVAIDLPILLKTFGRHLFTVFFSGYPSFFTAFDNVLDFLRAMDSYLTVDALKLYPDANPPRFESNTREDGSLELIYISQSKRSDLVEGFMEKTIEYYGTPYNIWSEKMTEDGSLVRFIISKQDDGRS